MTVCRHTNWVRLWRNAEGTGVEVTDRPHRLLKHIGDADNQFPGFLVLIGSDVKRLALTKLRLGNSRLCSRRSHGDIHLHLSSRKSFSSVPVVIADGDIPTHNRLPVTCRYPQCHEVTHAKFGQEVVGARSLELSDRVFCRSVFPFADVICLFVPDIGGIDNTLCRIESWVSKGPFSSSPIRPRLLLFVNEGQEKRCNNRVAAYRRSANCDIGDCFEDICVIGIPSQSARKATCRAEVKAGWDILRAQVLTSLELARGARKKEQLLFSAQHFAQFLKYGADSIPKPSPTPFNYITQARTGNEVPGDLTYHLENFLKQFKTKNLVKDVALPMIASSFVLDHYPPGMHHFDPQAVYRALYREQCAALCETACDSRPRLLLPENFLKLLDDDVSKRFSRFQILGSSRDAHVEQMIKFRPYLRELSSEDTCLWCLRRRPQTGLHCIHSICNTCDRIFGTCKDGNMNLPYVDACVLCEIRMENRVVRKPPDTATIRVLSMDGGGVRGIGSIEILFDLERRVGLPYSVIKHFDVCFATSCATGILLRLCDGGNIRNCMEYFAKSAYQVFKPRPLMKYIKKVPFLNHVVLALLVWFTDSKYSSNNLDSILKMEYGMRRSIMDHSKANEMGILLGVTLTTVRNSKTVVASNYNAVGERRTSLDYEMLVPTCGMRRIPLCELICSAMAAPVYFTPKKVDGVGSLQDGGLHANNPVKIAVEEVAALFPDRAEPSTVVSVGTGYSEPGTGKNCIARLIQAFWTQASSNSAWEKLPSHQKADKTTEHFRLDFNFTDGAPPLDDVDRMEDISKVARESVAGNPAMDRLANHLRAQLFYFELDHRNMPQFTKGSFYCAGFVLCRLEAGTEEFDTFMCQLQAASATFLIAEKSLPIIHNSVAKGISREFRRAVRFRVSSRQAAFDIRMEEIPGQSAKISGSPFTLDRLIGQQKLDTVFGTADHRKRPLEEAHIPAKAKRRRLR